MKYVIEITSTGQKIEEYAGHLADISRELDVHRAACRTYEAEREEIARQLFGEQGARQPVETQHIVDKIRKLQINNLQRSA